MDSYHSPAAALGTQEGIIARERLEEIGPVLVFEWVGFGRFGKVEEMATESEFFCAVAIGKEAVVADADEAVGQNMEKETSNELMCIERHGTPFPAVFVVSPGEGDLAIVHAQQPVV